VLQRSLVDIDSLLIADPDDRSCVAIAAGAPWFMALFGRDSLITAYMMLPVRRELAVGTLRMLASRQGTEVDDLSEEQPGRILHETRFTPDSGLALGGRHVYYGTADATPLFALLLAELWRWGEPLDALGDLITAADRALEWTRTYGDPDRDGFVEYQRTSERGLVNQGWRDSWNGVTFADGTIAEGPIALCEVQGYVYAALRGRAEMARAANDRRLARRLDDRADRLRDSFESAFWMPDLGYYAMALDGRKRPVDALTSSIGHLLWTGIVPDERAAALADLLVGDELFSGWGVRTLATSMGAYNPLSYHNGSVWPHDNAIVAHGLARYGLGDAACAVTDAMFDVAVAFGGRLPELFGGFSREEYPEPVPYPTACSPQAWASGAPLLMLRATLGLDVNVPLRTASLSPALPEHLRPMSWHGVRPGKNVVDVSVSEDGRSRFVGLPRDFEVSHDRRS
jgi:glycogen debranching enzyme